MPLGRFAFQTFLPYFVSMAARNDSPSLSIGTMSLSFTRIGEAAMPTWLVMLG